MIGKARTQIRQTGRVASPSQGMLDADGREWVCWRRLADGELMSDEYG